MKGSVMTSKVLIGLICTFLISIISISTVIAIEKQEKWPNKPIEVIESGAAGGTQDSTARFLCSIWSKYLGVLFTHTVIDGASGQIALATYMRERKKDEYTLFSFSVQNLGSV